MIDRRSIISGPEVIGTDPTDYFTTNIELIWDNMVAMFQVSDTCTYIKPAKKNCGGRLGFRIIYNHYLGPSNIDHMKSGAEKKLAKFTYTREKRNWTFEKYATLHKEQHNIL